MMSMNTVTSWDPENLHRLVKSMCTSTSWDSLPPTLTAKPGRVVTPMSTVTSWEQGAAGDVYESSYFLGRERRVEVAVRTGIVMPMSAATSWDYSSSSYGWIVEGVVMSMSAATLWDSRERHSHIEVRGVVMSMSTVTSWDGGFATTGLVPWARRNVYAYSYFLGRSY